MERHELREVHLQQRADRAVSIVVAGLVLIGLALLTARRVPVWQSDETLWRTSAMQMPGNVRVLINWHAQQLQRLDIAGHHETCRTLTTARNNRETDRRETWIIDRICLSR